MNKTYNGTLTRWHKVAERLGKEYAVLTNSAKEALTDSYVTEYLGPDQEARLRSEATQSLEKLDRAMRIQDVIVSIRQSLSAANEATGVSRELAEYEKLNRRSTLLNSILQAQGSQKATVSELKNVKKPTVSETWLERNTTKIQVRLLDAEGVERLSSRTREVSTAAYALADRIADLNRRTLEIAIPEDIAGIAGL